MLCTSLQPEYSSRIRILMTRLQEMAGPIAHDPNPAREKKQPAAEAPATRSGRSRSTSPYQRPHTRVSESRTGEEHVVDDFPRAILFESKLHVARGSPRLNSPRTAAANLSLPIFSDINQRAEGSTVFRLGLAAKAVASERIRMRATGRVRVSAKRIVFRCIRLGSRSIRWTLELFAMLLSSGYTRVRVCNRSQIHFGSRSCSSLGRGVARLWAVMAAVDAATPTAHGQTTVPRHVTPAVHMLSCVLMPSYWSAAGVASYLASPWG